MRYMYCLIIPRKSQRISGIHRESQGSKFFSQRISENPRDPHFSTKIHIFPHKSAFFRRNPHFSTEIHIFSQTSTKKRWPQRIPENPKGHQGTPRTPGDPQESRGHTQNVSTILDSVGASGAHTSPTKPAEICDCTVTQKCPGDYKISTDFHHRLEMRRID